MKRTLIVIFILLSCAFLTACNTSKENLPPPAPLVSFSNTLTTTPLWSTRVGRGSDAYYLRMSPVIVGQTIYAADYSGALSAVDLTSGKTLWRVNVGTSLTSGVEAANGKLFVATGGGWLVALSQSDGSIIWKTPVSSEILATPTASGNTVFVKSIDGSLTALSQTDGKQLWRYNQIVPSLVMHISSQPQVVGKYVVAGFASGKLGIINKYNGNPLWVQQIATPKGATDIERMVDIDVSPVVINGVVYVVTFQGKMVALDLKSGSLIWQRKLSSYAGLAAERNTLYVSDTTSSVWAFNADNGAVRWRQKQLANRMISGPAIIGKYIVVADAEGYLHWLSKNDGHFVARNEFDKDGAVAAPVVKNNIVVVLSRSGVLYAYKK